MNSSNPSTRFSTSSRDKTNQKRNGAINQIGGRMMAKKMLVIDDEQVVLESCRKIFEAEGFEVTTILSPEEGMKLASDLTFDVILCDW